MSKYTDTQAMAVVAANANAYRQDKPSDAKAHSFYPQRFAGKVAVVTGASRGIGLGIAQRLVQEGAKVAITGRNEDALKEAVAQLGGPLQAIGVAGKADDEEHRTQVFELAQKAFGSPVTVLVNNVGINPAYGPMIDIEPSAARKIFEVNALGTLEWTKAAYNAGMKDNGGSVVNVSSAAATRQPNGIGFYGSSKAMIEHITRQLAMELGPQIRVNAVAPAVVKTKFAEKLFEGKEEEISQKYPMKRLGTPEDVAAAAAFLLSDEASWITGQILLLDGGRSLGGES